MRANELRINNYVRDSKHKSEYFVTAIGCEGGWIQISDKYEDYDSSINELEPIPLTEEWLFRLGFEDKLTWEKGKFRYDSEQRLHLCNSNTCMVISYKVEYVHQLQNIYFALTGEELTIKE